MIPVQALHPVQSFSIHCKNLSADHKIFPLEKCLHKPQGIFMTTLAVGGTATPFFTKLEIDILQQLTVKKIAGWVGSLDASQIQEIAEYNARDVIKQLGIAIEATSKLDGSDSGSVLMKWLLPAFTAQLTTEFSTPGEFVERGTVFHLLRKDETGLLDDVEDKVLKGQISKGMNGRSTYFLTLHAGGVNILKLNAMHFQDGEKTNMRISEIG